MGLLDRRAAKPEYTALSIFGGWFVRKQDGYGYSFLRRDGDRTMWVSDYTYADMMTFETATELLDKLKGE